MLMGQIAIYSSDHSLAHASSLKKMSFCAQGRYFFLTYSQVNDGSTHIQLLDFLRGLPGQPFRFCLVGRERHDDGGTHFHVFIDWGKRRKFTSPTRFDFNNYHPNIQACRDPTAALQYCEKDGDTLSEGDRPDLSTPERESRSQLWGRLLDEATSASDFLSKVRVADPYTFATRYQALESMARSVYRTTSPYVSPYEPQDFKLPEGIESWLLEEFDEEVSVSFIVAGAACLRRPCGFTSPASTRRLFLAGPLTGTLF